MGSTQPNPEHDLKLEVVVIPVSDVDRAKRFYGNLGWRLDADFAFENGFRIVQFTPPGSECSIQFGTNVTSAAPGSAQGLYLVVSDIEAARNELAGRSAGISEVFHPWAPGAQFQSHGTSDRVSGPAPDHASYGSFATFSDPDGNRWLLQEIKKRLPGRGLTLDVSTLTELLRETETHHGEYEPSAPVGLVRRLHHRARAWEESRRGGERRHAPHRKGPRARAGVETVARHRHATCWTAKLVRAIEAIGTASRPR
jgi:catechol 2,3-dioxygenase-like lactoylglutathione lyase family enzyme